MSDELVEGLGMVDPAQILLFVGVVFSLCGMVACYACGKINGHILGMRDGRKIERWVQEERKKIEAAHPKDKEKG